MKRMQKFIVKYAINYKSGKKWVTQREAYGITQLGAIDTIEWLHKNNDVSIISVEPTGQYSAPNYTEHSDNYAIGER
jgi:hypothetical protein